MTAHAALGASGAYRWMNCPGSVRMSAGIESKSSVYADEGTAAHTLAETCLHTGEDAAAWGGYIIEIDNGVIRADNGEALTDRQFEVTEAMVDAVQVYLDAVRAAIAPGDELRVEHRVVLGDDMFGTADATVIKRADQKVHVFDFKYGAGVPVEVQNNPQAIYYGEGAVRDLDFDVAKLEVTIVQPRCPHPDGPVRSFIVDALTLLDWSIEFSQAAARTRDPDAPLNAGSWCRWCPASGACPALANKALAVAQMQFDDLAGGVNLPAPELMTPGQLGVTLDGLPLLEEWAKSVREHAYDEANAGRTPPGYKLVDKVARRKWREGTEGEVLRLVAAGGVKAADAMTPPKLKSPAQIEKLVGKKDFAAELAQHAPAVSSGTTLAHESDRRPAIRPPEEAFDMLE